MNEIELLDTVELVEDVPDTKLHSGMIGTVVECLSGDALLVEITGDSIDELLVDCFQRRQLKLDMSASDMDKPVNFDLPNVIGGKMAYS